MIEDPETRHSPEGKIWIGIAAFINISAAQRLYISHLKHKMPLFSITMRASAGNSFPRTQHRTSKLQKKPSSPQKRTSSISKNEIY
jgi:hypothetical protein